MSLARTLKPWLPAIFWAMVISLLSTDSFSEGHTSRFIMPVLRWALPHASVDTLHRLNFLIRKTAHFTEYFLFSLLLTRALQRRSSGWTFRWAIVALAIAAGYSALDEFHQSFVPSRTASPWDSMLDTAGAAFAQITLWIWTRFHARRSDEAGPARERPSDAQ